MYAFSVDKGVRPFSHFAKLCAVDQHEYILIRKKYQPNEYYNK